jgi:prolyl oligopeptidase
MKKTLTTKYSRGLTLKTNLKTVVSSLTLCVALAACSQPENTNEAPPEDAKAMSQEAAVEAPLFYEEVEGEQAMAKVNAWNERSLAKLMGDPRFDKFKSAALDIVNAKDRIAYGSYSAGAVYNFWQDETNVRGVLRRTSLEQYKTDDPQWEVLLDIDALNKKEETNWVYKGSSCLEPELTRCMVSLSNGGKDAVELREWDHDQKAFIENGFYIPEAKGSASWVDKDTLIVSTDWGEGSLTESGYPRISKLWKRGKALEEATVMFEGETTDVAAGAFRFEIAEDSYIMMGYRSTSFYDREYFWLKDGESIRLPLPTKSSPQGVFSGQMVVNLQEDWAINDTQTYESGTLVSFDFMQWMKDQTIANAQQVYAPDEISTVRYMTNTKSKVLISVLENVVGKIYTMDYKDGKWEKEALEIPGTGTLNISSVSDQSDIIFVNQNTFLQPNTQMLVNVVSKEVEPLKQSPTRFNADDLIVEQKHAESADGTKVPYFVVRKKETVMDGSTPTLLYAYGGFQVSMTPRYSGITGKLWLENGGAYVLANIRGGGEFGPKWHQAGLKTNRQVIYDDMAAVAEDLIESKLTSSKRLGIMGGSNGGLLMGVMYNQRPDLFNAVVCQVPLLDMLRYHKLLAGASWVGEYGSPDIPEERAFLEKISPVHNVKASGEYPPIFFVTSTKDDRVHPGHARKMAHVLEELGHSFEYYENIDGGHSAAADLQETAKRSALEYTFLAQQLMD